jgi:hypothetical protein
MYKSQISQINQDIDRTGKAIIAFGCSFVQGQGAINDELYTEYQWKYLGLGTSLEMDITNSQKKEIVNRYNNVTLSRDNTLDFTFMEYDNSFINVLSKKYFEGSYASINLGIRGCGNRASIKELYFYPEIHWDKIKEVVLVYCPSGLERFDFINDQYYDHGRWVAMWPHFTDKVPGPRKDLWKGYHDCLYSEKFEVLEQIAHVQELMLWCKHHKNARLIITPGFDRRYTREYFQESLKLKIDRSPEGEKTKQVMGFNSRDIESTVSLFPWENIFKPQGHETFVDLVLSKEVKNVDDHHFFSYLGTGSPNKWITACAHPSAKGHDLFAHELYKKITSTV